MLSVITQPLHKLKLHTVNFMQIKKRKKQTQGHTTENQRLSAVKSIYRPESNRRRRPSRPYNARLDQVRLDSGISPADLWRSVISRTRPCDWSDVTALAGCVTTTMKTMTDDEESVHSFSSDVTLTFDLLNPKSQPHWGASRSR